MDEEAASVPQKQPLVILATPRLILRAACEPDISIMWERVLGDSEVMRYVFQGGPMTAERAEQVMRKFFTFGNSLTGIAVLADRPTGELIGFAGLFPCEALGAPDLEIGFVLSRNVWGKGIATEIGHAQLAFGFEQLNCQRLLGLVDPRNGPSIHALQKLGLHYVKDVTEPGRANRSVFCIEVKAWRSRAREQRA
ncbi:MAG TPA: GNAT family N-acetyltransferase [Bradyrhizobium sp.]|nr:GNAT family N-acetyltransferase [Bradyrhizobium sp.]